MEAGLTYKFWQGCGNSIFKIILADCLLVLVTLWVGKRGGTRVLLRDGVLWYRSAIAFAGARRQTLGCVGKVRASYIRSLILSLRHPADTK